MYSLVSKLKINTSWFYRCPPGLKILLSK